MGLTREWKVVHLQFPTQKEPKQSSLLEWWNPMLFYMCLLCFSRDENPQAFIHKLPSMDFWPSLDNISLGFLGDEALMDENNSNFFLRNDMYGWKK